MWAVYFLSGKNLYPQQAAYYAASEPRASWTLTDRLGSMRGPAVHDINALFRLIHDDPAAPSSVHGDALDGTLTVSLDSASPNCGQLNGTVSATNTGRARWLPQAAPAGAVAVGVHLEDERGRMIDYDWARIPLIDGRSFDLPPDSTTDQPFRLPALAPGHYRLAFELVSEHVTWFGAAVVEAETFPRAPDLPATHGPRAERA
jgi:hypothetical protein